ncbi:MAG: T9SS type A sorting domain-containing protein [Flavobacteriales bacterium]|nr:T9SS type A sorting domain-containing protein [Flavobacteriales bacterium]
MKTFFTLVLTALLSISGYSQARMIFEGNIGLSFANGSSANPVYLVIDNPDSNALTDGGAPGGPAILSEDEYHIVKWNIDNSTGTYTVPFVSPTGGGLDYVAPNVVISGGAAGSGSIEFSTYHHDDVVANAPSDVNHMNQHPSGAPGGELFAMDRFWIIDAVNYTTKPSMVLTLFYDEDELEGTMVETNMIIQRYNNTSDRWLDLNLTGLVVPNAPGNFISTVPIISDADFFRSWTISSSTNPLPIDLLSFNAECKGNGSVELTWSTASEINNSHFTLERSEDGIIWETFADMIHGAGNSSTQNDYTHLDNNPFRGLTYYRLTQTDFDGTSETFDPIVNDCDGVGFEIISALSPEGSDQIQLVVSAARDEAFDIEVMDMSGKSVLWTSNVAMFEGLNYLRLDKSDLGYGIYIIKLQSQNELMTRKIFLN